MAQNKTAETTASVLDFIDETTDGQKREDSLKLLELLSRLSGFEPKMWGPTIIGFGSYHYKYDSGHQGDAPLAAFSPRKDALVLYFASEYKNRDELIATLGKCKTSKACVYVKKLSDINLDVLEQITRNSMQWAIDTYGSTK